MLQRFAAATAIASIAIALGLFGLVLTSGITCQKIYPLTIIWCVAPFVWGIWALIAPASWVPRHLPLWGAILGVIAGLLAAFVFNMPSRLLGQPVSLAMRAVAATVMVFFYYFLWMLVRIAYKSLAKTTMMYKTARS
jgi:hypothetical protein